MAFVGSLINILLGGRGACWVAGGRAPCKRDEFYLSILRLKETHVAPRRGELDVCSNARLSEPVQLHNHFQTGTRITEQVRVVKTPPKQEPPCVFPSFTSLVFGEERGTTLSGSLSGQMPP